MSTKSRYHLAEVIAEKTLHAQNYEELVNEVAAYLLLENKVNELEPLIRDIIRIRSEKGYVEADVLSAYPISEEVANDISVIVKSEYPKAENINIVQKIDPKIVGGIKVSIPDEQLDMSVRTKLSTFRRLTTAGKD